MPDYYIKNISMTGSGVRTSTIALSRGLNVIHGPSDTGKSYIVDCIDYMFGATAIRIESTSKYNAVHLSVLTPRGEITMTRPLGDGSNKISVSSTDPHFDSGEYNARSSDDASISNLWLKLIGIDKSYRIIKNENFTRQRLTWRTFTHMFLIKEADIFQERSILLSKQTTARTSSLSALLFLLTGRNYDEIDEQITKDIKLAKRGAVIDYINEQLLAIADRKLGLDKTLNSDVDAQTIIKNIISDIETEEGKLTYYIEQKRAILHEIINKSTQLTEVDVLIKRYQTLHDQYQSDIYRLAFTIEGELHLETVAHEDKCPFCENTIKSADAPSFLETSNAEIRRISAQLKDLHNAQNDIFAERELLSTAIRDLQEQHKKIEIEINKKLKPKLLSLKEELSKYREAVEKQKEMIMLCDLETSMQAKIFDLQTHQDDSELKYKPKEYLDKTFLKEFNASIVEMLEECNYQGISSARFDIDTMDIVVNGKNKQTFGKGYRAFLNTVLAFSLLKYLSKFGKYSPGLLILDSPILSMKEPMIGEGTDVMKSSLFDYLQKNQEFGQVIIVENNIPEIDYSKTQVLEFTGVKGDGRHGFLLDL